MAKTITFRDGGTTYKLTYTREAVEKIESKGFSLFGFDDKLVTNLPIIFHGAFYANHPKVTVEEADKILGKIKDKIGLYQALVEAIKESVETLFTDPEADEKNISWTVGE